LFGAGFHAIGLSRRNGEDVRGLHAADDVTRSVLSGGGAEVPEGALFWLMESDRAALIDAARVSCAEAIAGLAGAEPLGAIAFDCGGRERALGDDGSRAEVAAIREGLGGAPFAGLYTMGEVARSRGSLGMHHLTLVVLAVA
jgi:small ligand-binding sensory domain FIST